MSATVPKVSIITRTKNRPALLERTLLSIREQTFTDWEWVLIDTGDQPPGEGVAQMLKDEPDRARRIEASGDLLMGAVSNIGVRAARSELVVLLDDDDTWSPEFLALAVARFNARPAPAIAGVACQTRRLYEHAADDGGWVTDEVKMLNPNLETIDLISLAAGNLFTVHSFLYEREVFETIGGYREDLPVLDDWDFNLRFLMQRDIDVLPKVLANWHIRPAVTGGADSNSLVSVNDQHIYYRSAIINGYLRDEFGAGNPGLGGLLASASTVRLITPKIEKLRRKLLSASEKIGRIDVRTKVLKDHLAKKK